MHEHTWLWYRRRSDLYGRWKCLGCRESTGRVGLDEKGRALLSGDEALALGADQVPARKHEIFPR